MDSGIQTSVRSSESSGMAGALAGAVLRARQTEARAGRSRRVETPSPERASLVMLGDNACVLWRLPRGITLAGLFAGYTRTAERLAAIRAEWLASKKGKIKTKLCLPKLLEVRRQAAMHKMSKGAIKTTTELAAIWSVTRGRAVRIAGQMAELREAEQSGANGEKRWQWVTKARAAK